MRYGELRCTAWLEITLQHSLHLDKGVMHRSSTMHNGVTALKLPCVLPLVSPQQPPSPSPFLKEKPTTPSNHSKLFLSTEHGSCILQHLCAHHPLYL